MGIRTTSVIIATGTLASQALIDAEDTIENFPVQSDMGNGRVQWGAPFAEGTTVPEPAQIRKALNFRAVGAGHYQFQMTFSYWTFDMMDYFLDTFLTTSGSRVRSKACSVRTYDETNTAIYLNCTMNYPVANPQMGGWQDVVIQFDGGSLVTS